MNGSDRLQATRRVAAATQFHPYVPPNLLTYRVDEKNRTVLRVDNFATVMDKKACDMSQVSRFCPERGTELKCQ